MYIRNRVDTSPTPVPWHTMRNHFLIFLGTMLVMFVLGEIYPSYRPVVSDTSWVEGGKIASAAVTADGQKCIFCCSWVSVDVKPCWQQETLIQPELLCRLAQFSSQVVS